MTTHQVLAIKDRAVDAYMRPMYWPAIGAAIRAFGDEINRAAQDNDMYKHPDDYDLYHLGIWDDNTGQYDVHEIPKMVAIGKQLKTEA